MIWLPAGGAKSPPSAETIARGEHYIRMEGKETYRFATKTMATTALESVRKSGLAAERHRPVHPAPGEHPDHRGGRQGPRPADGPDVLNVDRYGNTSAASVPIALAEAVNEGRVKVGDRIMIVAFGAGFTSRRGDDRVDGRPGTRAQRRRGRPARGRPRPAARRLGLGRSDPAGARRAHGPARARSTCRSTTSSRASRSRAVARRVAR